VIIYLAGPMRPKHDQTLEGNLRTAKAVALQLWSEGYAVICPHSNCDLPYADAVRLVPEEVWLKGDIEIISRCDAVVVLPDYQNSDGTMSEIKHALVKGIPVFYWPDRP